MNSTTILVRGLLAAGVLASSACTTLGPDFETPEADLSETWIEQSHALSMTQDPEKWWSSFNDPVLDRLIETSYRQNLPLQVAGLRIFEARAQLGIAIGQQYPQDQQVNGGLTKVSLSKNSPNFNSSFADRSYIQSNVGLDAAWELDFWGRYRRGVESASANLGASIADYDNALVSLTAEVASVYVALRTLEERLKIARDNTITQQRSYKIADIRYRNGAVSELDPSQALSLLKSTQSTVPLLESQIRQAHNALSILMGMPPGDLQEILQGEGSIPEPLAELNTGVPADLLRRRPDIRRAELQAASQSALIGVAKTDLYPRFALLGSIGLLNGDTGSNSNSDLFKSDSVGYNFGPAVSWQVLNYGRLKNQVRVQDARLEALLVNYSNTVLQAAREVEDGISAYMGARDQSGFLRDSVKAAQRSVDLALVQYREGAVDYQRVLDTQKTLLATQDTHTSVRGDVVRGLIATYKALGGGWEIRAGNAFVSPQRQEQMKQRTDWGHLLDSEAAAGELPPVPPTGTAQPLLNAPDW
ncbi:MAG TPA: efflux transporter outer membrane subunit [Gammaproteobacteria bacterium]|nr:efflux transporter outer membrane subunit [Gammaproteobacteria bacterium]